MKGTQNEKILQVKNETLVVGIDIGKEMHYARAFDQRGIELAKLLKFSNTAQGYEALRLWMQNIMQQNEKTGAIVGFEPTGHYWFTLGDYLKSKGYKLGIVTRFTSNAPENLTITARRKATVRTPRQSPCWLKTAGSETYIFRPICIRNYARW